MSAYITLVTPMTDRQCLLDALADLGFDAAKVEAHAEAVALEGFRGDRREQRAHVVIRRRHLGSASNDLGFLATPTGHQLIVSDYDRHKFGDAWVKKLAERYSHHRRVQEERAAEQERLRIEEERRALVETQRQTIHERAKKLGYRVEESREGDKLRLVLVRRVY
ncbi:MAG: DUF1257 domain-containing protein [Polyangiaceae bacterium]